MELLFGLVELTCTCLGSQSSIPPAGDNDVFKFIPAGDNDVFKFIQHGVVMHNPVLS